MPKNDRYPRRLDDAYYYIFTKYVADFGNDKAGVKDAITEILIDLGLDPKSLDDRKWAVEKFRKANPNYYNATDKKKVDVNKNTTNISLSNPPFRPPIWLNLKDPITIDMT